MLYNAEIYSLKQVLRTKLDQQKRLHEYVCKLYTTVQTTYENVRDSPHQEGSKPII